jgi:uncharacterized protein involved in type VI secretion and phage assembly
MNQHASHQTPNLAAAPRYAIVDSYDPNTHRAKVVLAPSSDGQNPLTGMLPMVTGHMGAGWGLVSPLQKGDQVIVMFMQHHPDQGVILGRIFDQPHQPPKRADNSPAQAGEVVLKDKSGNTVQLGNNQKVLINGVLEIDLTGPTITLTATTAVNVVTPSLAIGAASGGNCAVAVTGTITATGEITANGGHTVSAHKHGGVQTGSGQTATPTG